MSSSPPAKRRTSRACGYCKSRKQRCGGYTAELKCTACQQRKIRCSFEDEAEDPRYNPFLRYGQVARQNSADTQQDTPHTHVPQLRGEQLPSQPEGGSLDPVFGVAAPTKAWSSFSAGGAGPGRLPIVSELKQSVVHAQQLPSQPEGVPLVPAYRVSASAEPWPSLTADDAGPGRLPVVSEPKQSVVHAQQMPSQPEGVPLDPAFGVADPTESWPSFSVDDAGPRLPVVSGLKQSVVATGDADVGRGTQQHQSQLSHSELAHDITKSPVTQSPLPSDFRGPLRTLQRVINDDLTSIDDVDPIRKHLITPGEATILFQIFFKHCHPHAPFLDIKQNSDWKSCQRSSALLFLGILQVAARFWGHSSRYVKLNGSPLTDRADSWLHPRYMELVAFLDTEMTRLTLRPRDSDASLATLQGLLLYAHWMPLRIEPHGQVRFRFSETGAWQALGLAIRWASQLGLDGLADFDGSLQSVQQYRTLAYLTESDHYLSLSTQRRSTLDTKALATASDAFLASKYIQSTDLRVVSLLRVAHASSIILRGVSAGAVSVEAVKAFNEDVIHVEHTYLDIASRQGASVDSHARQFPYTSLRWYRLAFASVLLNSASPWSAIGEIFHWAINWASQILFFLSGTSHSNRASTGDTGALLPDPSLVEFLTFAIDHYYVVVAYSAAFLVVAWRQGTVDDRLEMTPQAPVQLSRSQCSVSRDSLIYRLVDLAANTLFACASKSQHLAIRYAHFIRGLADTLVQEPAEALISGQPAAAENALDPEDWDISYLWQQAGLDPGFLNLPVGDLLDINNDQNPLSGANMRPTDSQNHRFGLLPSMSFPHGPSGEKAG